MMFFRCIQDLCRSVNSSLGDLDKPAVGQLPTAGFFTCILGGCENKDFTIFSEIFDELPTFVVKQKADGIGHPLFLDQETK